MTAHDLRESGHVENDSAAVVLIQRTSPGSLTLGTFTLELSIGKNRYGRRVDPENPLRLYWHFRSGRIDDLDAANAEGAA